MQIINLQNKVISYEILFNILIDIIDYAKFLGMDL